MKNPRPLARFLLSIASFTLTALPAAGLFAAEMWVDYESESGVFSSRMIDGHGTSSVAFTIDNKRAVHSEETSILVDQRPYKNVMKSYVIKFDQTFGPGLTNGEIAQLLEQEFQNYTNFYKNLEGVVRQQSREGYEDHLGGEIHISYRDPTFGVQSIRARILFNTSTRLQQIVVGPDDLMNSFQTRDYFESLRFNTGISVTSKDFVDSWKIMESPTGMFTLLYPPQMAPPYYTQLPTAKWDANNEMVSMSFNDPVRGEKVFFNVYGYKFNSEMNFTGQQEVLTKRHITKFRNSINGLQFSKGMDVERKTPFMETSFPIKPSTEYPYIRGVKLKSYFAGNYMMVQEVMTSNALFNSTLVDNLMRYTTFTPDKIHEPSQPQIYSAPAAVQPVKVMRKDAAVPTTEKPAVPKHPGPEDEPPAGAPPTEAPPAAPATP